MGAPVGPLGAPGGPWGTWGPGPMEAAIAADPLREAPISAALQGVAKRVLPLLWLRLLKPASWRKGSEPWLLRGHTMGLPCVD